MRPSSPPPLSEADLVALLAPSITLNALCGPAGWGATAFPDAPSKNKDETLP